MGMKASNAIATFFKYFVLILVGLIMIYPLLWMVSATFKDNSEIFAGISLWIKTPPYARWLPQRPEQLRRFHQHPAGHAQHLQLCHPQGDLHGGVLPVLPLTALAVSTSPGRKLLFNIMLATLFLPQVVLNVPQYLLYNKFGWVDSPLLSGHLGALRICYRDLLRVSAGAVHAQRPA